MALNGPRPALRMLVVGYANSFEGSEVLAAGGIAIAFEGRERVLYPLSFPCRIRVEPGGVGGENESGRFSRCKNNPSPVEVPQFRQQGAAPPHLVE